MRTLDLTDFGARLRAHVDQASGLWTEVTLKPITSGLSKNSAVAWLESVEWFASVSVWESGEVDVEAHRKVDGWTVTTTHDGLEFMDQLDPVLAELVDVVRDGTVPTNAFTS